MHIQVFDISGISAFYQYSINNSTVLPMTKSIGGGFNSIWSYKQSRKKILLVSVLLMLGLTQEVALVQRN